MWAGGRQLQPGDDKDHGGKTSLVLWLDDIKELLQGLRLHECVKGSRRLKEITTLHLIFLKLSKEI